MLYLPALVQRVPALHCPRRRLPLSLGLPALGTASPKPKSQWQLWPILYSASKLSKTKHISLAPTPPYEIAGSRSAFRPALFRSLVLSGACAPRRPRAHARLPEPVPIRKSRHLRRHRPLLARPRTPHLRRRAGRVFAAPA